eukprot:257166-Amphidinium_carterae.1
MDKRALTLFARIAVVDGPLIRASLAYSLSCACWSRVFTALKRLKQHTLSQSLTCRWRPSLQWMSGRTMSSAIIASG